MTIGERLVGEVAVLDVTGEMTQYTGQGSVRERVSDLLDRGHLGLLLNLSDVPYMDSSSVGDIAGSFITVRNHHGTLKIATSVSAVTKLLAIAKLDTVMEVFDTEAEALQSFD